MIRMSEKFGDLIKTFRMIRGISQEQLALYANVNVSFVGQIERGTKKPTIETIDKLLEALDVSYEDFFSFEKIEESDTNYPIIDKIVYELKTRTTEEQQLIYDVMRRILVYNDYKGL